MQDSSPLPHIPAAFQVPRPAPEPIAMLLRLPYAPTANPSDSTRQRWAQLSTAIEEARAYGHADGVRQGYGDGFLWGLFCGAVSGALVASIAWSLWLTVSAPEAAPPSATRAPTVAAGAVLP